MCIHVHVYTSVSQHYVATAHVKEAEKSHTNNLRTRSHMRTLSCTCTSTYTKQQMCLILNGMCYNSDKENLPHISQQRGKVRKMRKRETYKI